MTLSFSRLLRLKSTSPLRANNCNLIGRFPRPSSSSATPLSLRSTRLLSNMAAPRHLVAKVSDLKDGEKQEVKIGESPVLLVKYGGQFYATGSKCTHYGAPLAKGVLTSTGRLTCPWHGACFNAKTGDIEDAPAIDKLLTFKVVVEGENVYIEANEDDVKQNQTPPCKSRSLGPSKDAGVVIVGGGSGGWATAEELCARGYKGKVTMLTKEPYQPIDRTKLSKALITDSGKIALRTPDMLASMGLELKHVGAASVDKANKTVKLEDGSSLLYAQLILSPGASPVRLPIEGADALKNIHTLRTIPDAKAISDAMGDDKSKDVVILGGSFIGTEIATAAVARAKSVTVVEPKYPMKAVLGDAVAKRLVALYEENGVKFVIGQGSVKRFLPSSDDSNKVGQAELDNGSTIPADVVVLATGVKPSTDFLQGAFNVQKDGGIDVDQNLLIQGEQDIYAIGDIARFKDVSTGYFGRIEHWNIAQNHGRAAARAITGEKEPFHKTPVFWSAQMGKQLRYCGHATEYDDVLFQGSLQDLSFSAYYTKGDTVLAVCSIMQDPVMSKAAELFQAGKMLSATDIRNGKSVLDVPV